MTTAIPAVTNQDACPHPIEARTTRTDHGTYDYDYEVCIICGCERPVHGDDDGCRICDAALDGGPGHEWAPGRGTEDAGASADAFPLTCQWCKHAPATHLAIADWRNTGRTSADRHEHRLCAGCGHSVTVLPEGIVGWWLFELVPDHCDEGA